MTRNLDLLVDEPLELAVALDKLARKRVEDSSGESSEWNAFVDAMGELIETLRAVNEPGHAAKEE
jgi:hypothetical protein